MHVNSSFLRYTNRQQCVCVCVSRESKYSSLSVLEFHRNTEEKKQKERKGGRGTEKMETKAEAEGKQIERKEIGC